ncbi:MAG: glycosyltransferase family 2 protein [Naasia sp.]
MQTYPHIVVVMPAYNEEAGLPGFLAELADHLRARTARLSMVLVDDCSTDRTREVAAPVDVDMTVLSNPTNRGHGPTALAAYRAGVASGADLIVHVDGDGQFSGADVARVVDAAHGLDVIHGVRTGREEAWFRRVVTGALRCASVVVGGVATEDVNTPLRAYRREAVISLLGLVDESTLAPHVFFSILEHRFRLRHRSVVVRSLPPRGAVRGSMFGGRRLLPPLRLISFVARAGLQLLAWLPRIRASESPLPRHP